MFSFPEDIGFLILYVLPGFLFIEVFSKISFFERDYEEYEKIIFSFVISSLIFFPYSFIMNIKTFDEAKSSIYIFQNFLSLLIIGIILGGVIGFIYKKWFEKDTIGGSCWDNSFMMDENKSGYVDILLKSGKEYVGEIKLSTSGSTEKGLLISNVKMLIRDNMGDVKISKDLNGDMLIFETNIENIVFLYNDEEKDIKKK